MQLYWCVQSTSFLVGDDQYVGVVLRSLDSRPVDWISKGRSSPKRVAFPPLSTDTYVLSLSLHFVHMTQKDTHIEQDPFLKKPSPFSFGSVHKKSDLHRTSASSPTPHPFLVSFMNLHVAHSSPPISFFTSSPATPAVLPGALCILTSQGTPLGN